MVRLKKEGGQLVELPLNCKIEVSSNEKVSQKVFVTYSGKKIDFSKFTENDICLIDIAHHLTKICRFGGALDLNTHYSVAEHSLILSKYVFFKYNDRELSRLALLHDASEAYMGDVVSGLKKFLPDYSSLEETVTNLIYRKYGINRDEKLLKVVKELDTRIILDESKALLPQYFNVFKSQLVGKLPLDIAIEKNKSLEKVRLDFLMQCLNLDIEDELNFNYGGTSYE